MLTHPVVLALLTACVAAIAAVVCCAIICFTLSRFVGSALQGSRSVDRPKIIRALTHAFPHILRPWWHRR